MEIVGNWVGTHLTTVLSKNLGLELHMIKRKKKLSKADSVRQVQLMKPHYPSPPVKSTLPLLHWATLATCVAK